LATEVVVSACICALERVLNVVLLRAATPEPKPEMPEVLIASACVEVSAERLACDEAKAAICVELRARIAAVFKPTTLAEVIALI
jgi:hypothetical protein